MVVGGPSGSLARRLGLSDHFLSLCLSASRKLPLSPAGVLQGCSASCGEQAAILPEKAPSSVQIPHQQARSRQGDGGGAICSLNAFIEGLLCAWLCSRSLGYSTEPNTIPPRLASWDLHISSGILLFIFKN